MEEKSKKDLRKCIDKFRDKSYNFQNNIWHKNIKYANIEI